MTTGGEVLNLTAVLAFWVVAGYGAYRISRRNWKFDHDLTAPALWSAFGPIGIFVALYEAFFAEGHLLMSLSDRRNPFHIELQEALRYYRLIQRLPGDEAEKQREQLHLDIKELRSWPEKLKRHDGDRLVAAMKQELEQRHQLRHDRLQAYEKIEKQITAESLGEEEAEGPSAPSIFAKPTEND